MILHEREVRHGHFFCGLGGGARGFNRARAEFKNTRAKYRCIGGIDVDPVSIQNFGKLTGVKGTVLDLFSIDQFIAFHGRAPTADWNPATTSDIHGAFGNERPHIIFLSAPCKGFSGLLAEKTSQSVKYQALNELTLRGVWLMLEAYADDPVELIVFENVPRIMTRGRPLLDQITGLLRHFGYAVAETTHDCGELGNLAQSRKRFLLVARHTSKVPAMLYEPPKRPLRGVGEVLERLPLPGDIAAGGPMHRIPALQWKTWVRLAFVEAGADWRSLNKLAIEDGHLRDFGIAIDDEVPEAVTDPTASSSREGSGFLGVRKWEQSAGVVTANGRPGSGPHSIADPRPGHTYEYGQLGVGHWDAPASTIINVKSPGQGRYAVSDPRGAPGQHVNGKYRVTPWDGEAKTVIAESTTGNGAFVVADPRATWGADSHRNKLKVVRFDERAGTVTGTDRVGSGAQSVADPRPEAMREGREQYLTQGHYGVVPWTGTARAVTAAGSIDNGPWAVADVRGLPEQAQKVICRITALDGTWHRPFTTLELAALQSLFDPEDKFTLAGPSDANWREQIGNAVPSAAAEAIGCVMGKTLLMAWAGETFALMAEPIWVQPLAIALAVQPWM